MIKYKKPISITRKFQYGGAVAINPSYADDILQGLSQLGETIGGTVSQALSKIGPKVTPITRAVSKVAGPVGIASMILTPAQTNVGEDEWIRRLRSTNSFADFATSEPTEENNSDTSSTGEQTATASPSSQNNSPRNRRRNNSNRNRRKDNSPTEEKSLKNTLKRSKEQWNSLGRKVVGVLTSPWLWVPVGGGAGATFAYSALNDQDTIPQSPAQKEYKAVQDSIKEDNTRRETQRLRDSARNANTPRNFQFSDTIQNRQMLDSVAQLNQRRRSYGL